MILLRQLCHQPKIVYLNKTSALTSQLEMQI
jgi:hypothetical protein